MKRYLWWWVFILAVFVIAVRVSGNGSTAWTVAQDAGLAVIGILACVLVLGLLAGARTERRRRRSGK
jgi:uncharacterized membrane protein YhaH (DUF805 family)